MLTDRTKSKISSNKPKSNNINDQSRMNLVSPKSHHHTGSNSGGSPILLERVEVLEKKVQQMEEMELAFEEMRRSVTHLRMMAMVQRAS